MYTFLTNKFATEKYRWVALAFIAVGLAIVIIDNTVLVVAIPHIIRDLKTSFDGIQWVVSGYSLIIATLLITMGRVGDVLGRKRIFLTGVVLFAIGSFIASISTSALMLFLGEAVVEAFGAAMMLTTALAIIANEFRGPERAIAFGIWGSIAGASASIGPLLGGYITTFFSWRWSFRINVIVAIIALLGSVFIRESKGEGEKRFDWWGTLYSGLGLFSLVFVVIEGHRFSWWPALFVFAIVMLIQFVRTEIRIEKRGGHPLLRPSIFAVRGFSMGLTTLVIVSLGQFGVFFILPLYLQNVLGFSPFKTGLTLLYTSISVFIFGPISGFIASKIHPRWLVNTGMISLSLGAFLLARAISVNATEATLALPLVLFGMGIGMASSQLTNIVISAIPITLAGEASAASATMRQVGSAVGSAIMGMVLAATAMYAQSHNIGGLEATTTGAKYALYTALFFLTTGAISSFLLPLTPIETRKPGSFDKSAH